MRDDNPGHANGLAPGWQRRQGGVRFYVCCCPLTLLLAPVLLVARLAHYGTLRLLGRPATWPWADAPPRRGAA